MVAVVAKGDLREEAVGGGRLPRNVGCRGRHARLPVLGVHTVADNVAEVPRPFVRDLGDVPHAVAVALGPTVVHVVQARQAIPGGYPHVEPIV